MKNLRLLLQKKPNFQTESIKLHKALEQNLEIKSIREITIVDGFDIFSIPKAHIESFCWQVLGDPTTENIIDQDSLSGFCLSIEPLPGQFDQRADAAEQAAKLLSDELESTQVTSFKTYCFLGEITQQEKQHITNYLLNPVDSRIKDLSVLELSAFTQASPVPKIKGFITASETQLLNIKNDLSLSLTDADMVFIQDHFKSIQRNPTETEIRVLDTYWSDHCRHTTFLTEIEQINFPKDELNAHIQQAFEDYLTFRKTSGINERPITLMDLATINARTLRKQGQLPQVEISDEINACSVFINVNTDNGSSEKWLLQFKNETHNHPTEIEPYGGASTCLGGAIRDPLSGRAFVYQAMRITGSADPLEPISETLSGKLPQRKITQEAAHGFSSYGNQIGVATTQVAEIYHPGYKAKRMEVGAVVAATPAENVIRKKPRAGDKIILLGGKTGRDGCGGASGSSKAHTEKSITQSSAEVQKGNPPVERAIQRLFRNETVAKMIKKCNDFGAGGVCVAVGELADSLHIDLDKIPTKYAGLSGTELTISESQERMAVVVAPEHVDAFIDACEKENTLAIVIAKVTDNNTMIISHQGKEIVNLDRDFIETAGAKQFQKSVNISGKLSANSPFNQIINTDLIDQLRKLNNSSQRGLQDMFDSNVGASTVLLPYGGKNQSSPSEGSVQLLPKQGTSTASAITYGFDADISSYSPFLGGSYAVVEAVTKQIVLGAKLKNIHFSFQEYFERLEKQADKWGKPFASLLGAFSASKAFELAAIGGKDSMSGSFGNLHVPPTLIAFAVSHLEVEAVVPSELQSTNSYLYLFKHSPLDANTPNYEQLKQNYQCYQANQSSILSAATIKHSGAALVLTKASFGNSIGFSIRADEDFLFGSNYGSFIVESSSPLSGENVILLGKTHLDQTLQINDKTYTQSDALSAYQSTLESVFPLYPETKTAKADTPTFSFSEKTLSMVPKNQAMPNVFIPVFPGMNSEYDMANAFERNGATTHQQPFINLSQAHIKQSIKDFCFQLKDAQILALSGGFSAGDEPNGSGKYIAAVLRNEEIQANIHEFLQKGGLILGICNGFQALIKSGLLPYGKVTQRLANDATLEHNNSHRHIARIATTRICHTNSPWLNQFSVGETHQVAFSHGEGRFVANPEQLQTFIDNGQIATQYVNNQAQATIDPLFNPNGSDLAIEGITSPCGHILGKMGHSERYTTYCYKNYPDFKPQNLFASGVNFFKS